MLKNFMANAQCGRQCRKLLHDYPSVTNLSNKPGHTAAYEKSVSKLSFQNALVLRYHDSNVD